MGSQVYWSRPWHRFYLLVVASLTVDAVYSTMCGQRPLRFLRPLLIGLRNREQRRILLSLLHLLSHQLGVALLTTLGVVAFAGAFGVHLYGASFDAGLDSQLAALDESDLNHLRGTFNSFLHAAVEIWVLISSAENFLDLLLPAMRTGDGGHSFMPLLVYFGPLLYFGYFFIMSVLLAVVVDEYLLTARRLVQLEHHRERKGLLEAFALLNPDKTGYVDVRTWTRLMVKLRPDITKQEAILRYHMVALQDAARGVHVREFLRLHSNLAVNLVEEHSTGKPYMLHALPESLRLAILIANAVIFISYSPLQSSYTHRALFAAHTALLPLLHLDRKSWTPSRRALNGACLGCADACAILYWTCDIVLGMRPPVISQMGGQIALCLLLVQGSRVLRLIWRLLSYVLPQFLAVSVSVFMIVYVFSLLGMQLFHGLELTSGDERYAHENLPGCDNPFGSLSCTLFILFQVMTNEDWHVVLRAMWSTAGPLGLTFVLAFFLVVNVCLLSLTTALAINSFLASKTDLLEQGLLVDSSVDDTSHGIPSSFQDDGTPRSPGTPQSSRRARTSFKRVSRRGTAKPGAESGAGATCTQRANAVHSACAALHMHDDEEDDGALHEVEDEHQDLHLSANTIDRTKLALQQAELAMLEHEAVSERDAKRPALARAMPRPTETIRDETRRRIDALGGSGSRSMSPKRPGFHYRPTRESSNSPSRSSGARRKRTSEGEQSQLLDPHAKRSDGEHARRSDGERRATGSACGFLSPGGHSFIPSSWRRRKEGTGSGRGSPSRSSGAEQPDPTAAGSPPIAVAQLSGPPSVGLLVDQGRGGSAPCDPASSTAAVASDGLNLSFTANQPPSPQPLRVIVPKAEDLQLQPPTNKKWRVASRTVTMFSRRAAAGLMNSEEPLDHEEEAAIAELTQHA